MNRDPIKISYEDLASESVEGRLREQTAVRSTKEHYERANVVGPQAEVAVGWRAWFLKSVVYLALFGFLGGALGSGGAELITTRPDRAEQAAQWMADLRRIDHGEETGRYSHEDARQMRETIRARGQRNAAFVKADIATNGESAKHVPHDEAAARVAVASDRSLETQANLLAFAIVGFVVAGALASADRIIERDTGGAIASGVIAGILGAAIGAGTASLLPLLDSVLATPTIATTTPFGPLSTAAVLMLFAACVGAMPGIAQRDSRRTAAGIGGGLIGGVLGAVALIALTHFAAADMVGRVCAFALIGMAIGLLTGTLEEAAKQGWLRVASGLIAGKQFILYRNPTFIGSAPMSHIYLFRDPQVGRRHAAIFQMTGGGYEIENLPLGGPTLVNGVPVSRVRLKRGDQISIGRTTLVFDEKVAA